MLIKVNWLQYIFVTSSGVFVEVVQIKKTHGFKTTWKQTSQNYVGVEERGFLMGVLKFLLSKELHVQNVLKICFDLVKQ